MPNNLAASSFSLSETLIQSDGYLGKDKINFSFKEIKGAEHGFSHTPTCHPTAEGAQSPGHSGACLDEDGRRRNEPGRADVSYPYSLLERGPDNGIVLPQRQRAHSTLVAPVTFWVGLSQHFQQVVCPAKHTQAPVIKSGFSSGEGGRSTVLPPNPIPLLHLFTACRISDVLQPQPRVLSRCLAPSPEPLALLSPSPPCSFSTSPL